MKYYDAKHIFISFNIEIKVFLIFQNVNITRSSKKLNYKYYYSLKIELLIEKQTYRFRLFKT